jgi:hypothetical protein
MKVSHSFFVALRQRGVNRKRGRCPVRLRFIAMHLQEVVERAFGDRQAQLSGAETKLD